MSRFDFFRNQLRKILSSLQTYGLLVTFYKVKYHIRMVAESRRYYREHVRSRGKLDSERSTVFPKPVKISILVPLFNTPLPFLTEMIRSVEEQTYPNWELCLADASDTNHANVGGFCLERQKADPRIRYEKLARNGGISENTNHCIGLAGGEYLALLDHDDRLDPSALFEVAKAVNGTGADVVYTDECTFRQRLSDTYHTHFKPDFAIDTLRSNNYICHFLVFRRSLLEAAGLFRSRYDGSQDYDMVLRLSEHAGNIVHILRCCTTGGPTPRRSLSIFRQSHIRLPLQEMPSRTIWLASGWRGPSLIRRSPPLTGSIIKSTGSRSSAS